MRYVYCVMYAVNIFFHRLYHHWSEGNFEYEKKQQNLN